MKCSLFIFLFLFFGGFLFLIPTKSISAEQLLITEVQIAGQSSSNDFIEIYNPGDSSLNISSYKLRKRVKTGSEYSVRVFPEESVIPANGYFLWANSKDGYNEILGADVTSTQTLAKNNSIALLDSTGNVLDDLAWGSDLENPFVAEAAFPENPEANQSLERKFLDGNYQDTNDNANDFILNNSPRPQGSGGEPSPPEPVCEPTEEICDGIDNNCNDLIDEDLGEITCGIGACEASVANCINGEVQTCVPGTPTDEICDQIDNDCDEEIDEDGICETPEPAPEPAAPEGDEPRPENSGREPIIYPSGIFINEFLPSPEGPDVEGEWIEFYNSNAVSVDLSDWSIEDTKGSTKSYTFSDGTTIAGYGFLILGRPTSKIVLNNDGEGLILKNPLESLVDSVVYGNRAPQGQSYARKTDGTWQWSLVPSPGEENSFPPPEETAPEAEPELEPAAPARSDSETRREGGEPRPEDSGRELEPYFTEATEVKPQQPQPELITYPSGIVINEILPSPTGPDSEEEWIEIFNQNNFGADLSGWQIQDIKGRVKTYTFPQGIKIGPQGFLVLSRPTTKITFNNDGDGLNLIQPNNNIIDQVSYNKAPTGSSYNRTGSGLVWSDVLTPGSQNVVPAQTSKETEEEETNGSSKISEKGLAAIGKQFPKSSRSLFVLLTALVIAIFSGVIVFVLKKRIKSS